MKFQIQLDDDVAAIYATYAAARPGQTTEQVLAIQLQRYVHADPRLRILLVLPEERARLEELTSRMPITTISDLTARVAALAELSIGRIRFRWTPVQFRQLKDRATHWGISTQEYAERIVRQIEEQFFDMTPQPRKAGPPEEIRIKEGVSCKVCGEDVKGKTHPPNCGKEQPADPPREKEVHAAATPEFAAARVPDPIPVPTPVATTLRRPPAGFKRS